MMIESGLPAPAVLQDVFEALPHGALLLDGNSHIVAVNPRAEILLGTPLQRLMQCQPSDPAWDLRREDGLPIPEGERPSVQARRTGQRTEPMEVGLRRPDGARVWLLMEASPLAFDHVLVTFSDVTELHRSRVVLAARARLVEQAHILDRDAFLTAILDEAELLTESCIGFYHFVEEDQETLHLQTWSTRTAREFCRAVGKGSHYPVSMAGVWADCLRERRPIIHNDYEALPNRKGLPKGHAPVIRELTVPVMRRGRVVALMGVGNKPVPYTEGDATTAQLLADLAADLSEQKRYEADLHRELLERKEREAELDQIFTVNPDLLCLVDRTGRILRVNEAWTQCLGHSWESMVGHPFMNWVVPEDHPKTQAAFQTLLEGHPFGPFENRYRHADGSSRVLAWRAAPLGDRLIGAARDVTERIQAQEALRQRTEQLEISEQLFAALFNHNQTAMAMSCWPDPRLEMVNAAWSSITGWAAEEGLGRSVSDLGIFMDPSEVPRLAQELEQRGFVRERPLRLRHRQGNPRQVLWSGALITLHGTRKLISSATDITALDDAQQALRESEARFRSLFESLQEAFSLHEIILDEAGNPVDYRYLEVNAAFEVLTGVPRERWIGHTVREVLPGIEEGWIDAFGKVALTGNPLQLDDFAKPLNRWFQVQAYSPKPGQFAVLSLDITEAKTAALKIDAERKLFMAGPVTVFTWSSEPGWPVTYVSENVRANLGYDREELLRLDARYADLIHPEDLPSVEKEVRAYLAEGHPQYEQTYRLRRKDGTYCWVLDSTLVTYDPEGRVTSIRGYVVDQTEQQEAEWALTQSEARLRHYLEAAPLGVVVADRSGRFVDVNAAALKIFGFTREELLARSIPDVLPPEELSRGLAHFRQTMETGEDFGEFAFCRSDGSLRRMTVFAVRLDADKGLAFVEDVTERRVLEKQLQRSQKLESLGSLASGVAHDMNNVLGAILGLASAFQTQQAPESPLGKALDTISKACLRGRTMVQGLLGFARQDLVSQESLDLNQLVRDEVALLERTTLQQVTLRVALDPDLPPIMGDPGALSQALMNLCVNAVDAMPDGGTLALTTGRQECGWVFLDIADTGEGIPESIQDRVFEPFFTTKPIGKGTGLGLSMVYGTLKAHGGRMTLKSQVGQGTTIRLELPAAAQPEKLSPPESPAPDPVAASQVVLVVDDDELIRQSLEAQLSLLGHRTHSFACGEDALAHLEAGGEADQVILDMNMPGLGGRGSLARIRALRPAVPIYLATGRADQAALDLARSVENTTVLPKPFNLDELRRALDRVKPS